MQIDPHIVQVFHVDQFAPLLLAQVHQAAHIVVGGVEVDVHKGLLLLVIWEGSGYSEGLEMVRTSPSVMVMRYCTPGWW